MPGKNSVRIDGKKCQNTSIHCWIMRKIMVILSLSSWIFTPCLTSLNLCISIYKCDMVESSYCPTYKHKWLALLRQWILRGRGLGTTVNITHAYSPCTENGPPPPSVVLSRQLEICEGNGDTGRHTQQYPEHNKQYTVQRVLFPAPQGGKYVVQLNRYSTEMEQRYI